MKKIFRVLSTKISFFILCSITILALNLTPLITFTLHSPSGRTFPLIHNNVQDYFFYQSLMNQGASGNWLTTNPFTAEPHTPTFVFSYFLWLGKISSILGIPFAIMYHLTRIIFSIIFLALVYYFLYFLKIPYPKLAFLFFIFASPFLHRISDGKKIITVPFMYWWTGIDPIRRAAYLPHHMLASIIFLIIIILLIKFIRLQKLKSIIYAIILIFPLALLHPPSVMIILIIIPSIIVSFFVLKYFLNTILKNKIVKSDIQHQSLSLKTVLLLTIFLVVSLLSLLFMYSQTNSSIIWSTPFNWEKSQQFPLGKELIGAFGIIFPFALVGIIEIITHLKFEYLFISIWFLVPLILIPFAQKIGISNIRLIQGVPYLPLSILASLGVKVVIDFIMRFKKEKQDVHFFWQKTQKLIMGLTVIIFLVFTIPTLSWSLKDQLREYWPIFGNVYLDNRLKNVFNYINTNFPPKTITLSTFYTGNYLPSYTHTVSFIGHTGYTYNMEKKQQQVTKFFENKMSDKEAKEFLVSNKIALIFQGPEEKPIYNNYLYPAILNPIYNQDDMTLYKVK